MHLTCTFYDDAHGCFILITAIDLGGHPQALESIEVAPASHFPNLVTTALSVTACRHKTWAKTEPSTAVFRLMDRNGGGGLGHGPKTRRTRTFRTIYVGGMFELPRRRKMACHATTVTSSSSFRFTNGFVDLIAPVIMRFAAQKMMADLQHFKQNVEKE